MARLFALDVKCPGCKMCSSRVTFSEPKFLTPSHTQFKCEMCESWIGVKFSKDTERKTPGAVKVQARVTIASDTLLALQEEERQQKEALQKDNQPLPSVEKTI